MTEFNYEKIKEKIQSERSGKIVSGLLALGGLNITNIFAIAARYNCFQLAAFGNGDEVHTYCYSLSLNPYVGLALAGAATIAFVGIAAAKDISVRTLEEVLALHQQTSE